MSPLAKQVIDVLGKEEDNNLLAEVLDFYGYLKAKKRKEEDIKWQLVKEDEATDEEVDIINRYESNKTDNSISLDMLTKELGIYE
ncbi:hypothetical protein KPL40_11660 [Clostridium gasigenes]|uniref:hypothetical protein n=1 Tax=Clostridium gasigenes TaxID=94869 RepID=UPI001C0DC224|nr:hypothetical protein [Clostridium gasigenes]MBU3133108.1 hypothetical protein [Clostridium gasigenes]